MTCNVYVIGADNDAGPWKIGLSTNVVDRLDSLQSGSPVLLAVKCAYRLSSVKDAQKVERFAHGMLAEHRMHGEWFTADLEQVVDVVTRSALLLDGTSLAPVPPRIRRPRQILAAGHQTRYGRWREANPELYRERQRAYAKKWRAKQKGKV